MLNQLRVTIDLAELLSHQTIWSVQHLAPAGLWAPKHCNNTNEDQHLSVQVCRQQGTSAGMWQCQPAPSPLPGGYQATPLCYAMQRTQVWPLETKSPIVAFESQGTIPPTTALGLMGLWGGLFTRQLTTPEEGLDGGRGGER